MNDAPDKLPTCPICGQAHPTAPDVCPACLVAALPPRLSPDAASEWARDRDRLKSQWVASVVAFWVSAAVLILVYLIDGKLNLILTSIVLGMLVLGLWLKTRYQVHLRKDPGRR